MESESPTLGGNRSSEDLLSSPSTAQGVSHKELEGCVTGESLQAPSAKVDPPIHAEGLQSEVPSLEFLGAPLPIKEEERHEALCGLEVLDTATQQDEKFDDITKLVGLPVFWGSPEDLMMQYTISCSPAYINQSASEAVSCGIT